MVVVVDAVVNHVAAVVMNAAAHVVVAVVSLAAAATVVITVVTAVTVVHVVAVVVVARSPRLHLPSHQPLPHNHKENRELRIHGRDYLELFQNVQLFERSV